MREVDIQANHDEINIPAERYCSNLSEAKWTCLRQCTSLKSLTFPGMSLYYDRFSTKIYEGLENLIIINFHGDVSQLKRVVMACKNLKSIELQHFHCTPLIFDWLETLENVEKIVVMEPSRSNSVHHVRPLLQLRKLEHLGLDFLTISIGDLVRLVADLNEIYSLLLFDLHLGICGEDIPNFYVDVFKMDHRKQRMRFLRKN